MNIYVELNKIVEYIENHLEEKIDYRDLAKMIGVNEYTFQKIFSVICNISLAEYIRNRRLSNAGQDIFLKNEKIIDVSVRYQYGNSTAFSRAFEKFHGIKPSEVRKNPDRLNIYMKLHFDEVDKQRKPVEYKIVEMEKMILYGKCKNTNNQNIRNDAPVFFEEVREKYGKPQYGLVEYKDRERLYVKAYWVMYDKNRENLQRMIIPKCKWILIRIDSQETYDIQEASKMFYCDFLPSCKYDFKGLPEIEYYHDGITDFLIPIED